ncbi:hypothetical protein CEV34_4376 [Brucella pseudogrignonensis]|uniref:Uncharacterized protein n=1 Tax=Brucella pseudogrignonensis TaxID=419475 RepID=A0A256G642_9HYPH|nr:hypothetical protein CEV34_4376 [Brucella pseudogrignonensis]
MLGYRPTFKIGSGVMVKEFHQFKAITNPVQPGMCFARHL